jgi:IS30 family transposase
VEEHLKKKWSPEQIVGYCKENDIYMVSLQTIYEYVHDYKALGRTLHTIFVIS